MEFVAFDFETANRQRSSACSLGAVKVVDGIMVKHFYELIDPQTSFSPENIDVHGITPNQVYGKPTYDTVIKQFQEFVGEAPVVSHSKFDQGVIRAFMMTSKITTIECLLKAAKVKQFYMLKGFHQLLLSII